MKSIKRLPVFKVIKDLKNYRKWVRTIRGEREYAQSNFNKFGMSHNYFYVLYFPVTLPQEDAVLPENIKRLRLVETLAPVHQYLDNDLGFADYIIPEFNQFYDEDGEPTLTYGIVYRFAFKKLSLRWAITRGIFISLLTWILIKWPIFSTLWELIF